MLNISGYTTAYDEDLVDHTHAVSVNSCGHYMLIKQPIHQTVREGGRNDYQLLYMVRGQGDFVIDGQSYQVTEGQMVLYRPKETQRYRYALSETPELYWLHFSGSEADKLVNRAGFEQKGICFVENSLELTQLFTKIILELQLKQKNFYELCNLYATELFMLISRITTKTDGKAKPRSKEIEDAVSYFYHHFSEPLSIQEYAKSYGITPCWFIRNFKNHTGITPQAYLTNIRINAAKELLTTSLFNISEIANLSGYPNPLYFSRIFKKQEGVSPSEYRLNKLK